MFNATLAGHHLRPDYSSSRSGSRAGSRFDLNEVGRYQVGWRKYMSFYHIFHDFQSHPPTPQYHHHHQVHPQQLAERITMLDDVECEGGEHKSCYSRYKTCCYLTVVFSVITATIVIIIYVALGGLRGGSEGLGM